MSVARGETPTKTGQHLRAAAVIAVLALMSYVTYLVHNHYWHDECYDTVVLHRLYVVHDAKANMLRRFSSRYGGYLLVDLRTDGEKATEVAGGIPTLPVDALQVHRMPLAPNALPVTDQVVEFLDICRTRRGVPVMLYPGTAHRDVPDLRAAILAAAYLNNILKRPADDALSTMLPAGSPHRESIDRLLEELTRRPRSGIRE
jgi:hypothetical protein